jgi:hypothetical protein
LVALVPALQQEAQQAGKKRKRPTEAAHSEIDLLAGATEHLQSLLQERADLTLQLDALAKRR